MTPNRAREVGYEQIAKDSYTKELFTVYVGGEAEHRTHWSRYNPDVPYGLAEAIEHAKEVKTYLSTGNKRVKVFRSIEAVDCRFEI